jgi:hypothetical protein
MIAPEAPTETTTFAEPTIEASDAPGHVEAEAVGQDMSETAVQHSRRDGTPPLAGPDQFDVQSAERDQGGKVRLRPVRENHLEAEHGQQTGKNTERHDRMFRRRWQRPGLRFDPKIGGRDDRLAQHLLHGRAIEPPAVVPRLTRLGIVVRGPDDRLGEDRRATIVLQARAILLGDRLVRDFDDLDHRRHLRQADRAAIFATGARDLAHLLRHHGELPARMSLAIDDAEDLQRTPGQARQGEIAGLRQFGRFGRQSRRIVFARHAVARHVACKCFVRHSVHARCQKAR